MASFMVKEYALTTRYRAVVIVNGGLPRAAEVHQVEWQNRCGEAFAEAGAKTGFEASSHLQVDRAPLFAALSASEAAELR